MSTKFKEYPRQIAGMSRNAELYLNDSLSPASFHLVHVLLACYFIKESFAFCKLVCMYRLLHPREYDIRYTRTKPEGRRPKGEVRVYRILHERGCNNVFISAEAILCMRTTCYCAMLLYYFEITTRLKQAPVNVER